MIVTENSGNVFKILKRKYQNCRIIMPIYIYAYSKNLKKVYFDLKNYSKEFWSFFLAIGKILIFCFLYYCRYTNYHRI
jgi:hypothetical protein